MYAVTYRYAAYAVNNKIDNGETVVQIKPPAEYIGIPIANYTHILHPKFTIDKIKMTYIQTYEWTSAG